MVALVRHENLSNVRKGCSESSVGSVLLQILAIQQGLGEPPNLNRKSELDGSKVAGAINDGGGVDRLDEDVETPVEDTDIELSGNESDGTTFKPTSSSRVGGDSASAKKAQSRQRKTTPSSSEDDSSEDDTPPAKKQKNSQSSGRDIPRKNRAEPFEDDSMSMEEADNHSRGFPSDNGVSEVGEPSVPDKGKGKAKAEPDNVGNSEDNSEAAYGPKGRNYKGKGKARDQIFVPLLFLSPHPPTRNCPLPPRSPPRKRATMASKHTPDDQKLIDILPLGVVMAFRSSVRDVSHAPDVNNDIWYLPAASKIDAFNDSAFLPPNDLENFGWSFLDNFGSGPADASITSITSSFEGVVSFSAQFSAPASPLRLPPIPISPSPPPVPIIAPPAAKPLSRKRKNDIDGLDPANMRAVSQEKSLRKRKEIPPQTNPDHDEDYRRKLRSAPGSQAARETPAGWSHAGLASVDVEMVDATAAIAKPVHKRKSDFPFIESVTLDTLDEIEKALTDGGGFSIIGFIACYGEISRFVRDNKYYIDLENRALFLTVTNQRWLAVHLDALGSILVFLVGIFAAVGEDGIDQGQIGLILTYTTSLTQMFAVSTRLSAEVENYMNSVERVVHYATSYLRRLHMQAPQRTSPRPTGPGRTLDRGPLPGLALEAVSPAKPSTSDMLALPRSSLIAA
ncbi:hypothetical protein DFH08DRAFT_1090358 [Mycena albidolilacea]|uniref:ABC transmembrane type-1 domain-containing protein n=1 Tax=Mycena albidolilacea TaxID=1033008 RepID=A0AAD7E7E4_9AGAR|nr:hypothetical protein DFH08DRAFT_1090358 [Mycena albidolilacea]